MRTSSYEGCAQTNLATPAPGLDQQKAKEYLGMGDFFFRYCVATGITGFLKHNWALCNKGNRNKNGGISLIRA